MKTIKFNGLITFVLVLAFAITACGGGFDGFVTDT
jgi:predicted small secreted protein